MTLPCARTTASSLGGFERDGYATVPGVLDEQDVAALLTICERLAAGEGVRRRANATYAVRSFFEAAAEARFVLDHPRVRSIVEAIVGPNAHAVRAILFDKNPQANWSVTWHQDTTIAVRERRDVPGFGPWSVKAGVVHVRPPSDVLERMVTLRLHLDECDETNGALEVMPGSHRLGLIDDGAIDAALDRSRAVCCPVPAGGALVMRPLLLHASSPAKSPRHRRVLHIEFAGHPLPSPLQWATA